jgi:nucleoporin NUP82
MNSLELSTNTLPSFTRSEAHEDDGPAPSGRRRVMVIRDTDLIVAAGSELRMTPLGDDKLGTQLGSSYTVCTSCLMPRMIDASNSFTGARDSRNSV